MAKVKVAAAKKKKAAKVKRRPIKVKKAQGLGLADAGQALGAYLGGPVGSIAGRLGGGLLARITGFGDYQVNQNTLAMGGPPPSFYNRGNGYEVCHKEFVAIVAGTAGETYTRYPINPGLVDTFPWLSAVALNFDEYEILGLVFEYRPTSGMSVNSTNPNLGYIVMSTQYNPLDTPFASRIEMESYEYSTSGRPCDALMHPVECDPKQRPLQIQYVRHAAAPAGSEQMYDLGAFTLLCGGLPGNNPVGELWVTYHARFRKPRLGPTGTFAHFIGGWHPATGVNSCTAASPLGDTVDWRIEDEKITGFITRLSATKMSLQQAGYYRITAMWQTALGAAPTVLPTITYGTGYTVLDNTVQINNPPTIGTSTAATPSATYMSVVKLNTSGTSLFPPANDITFGGLTNLTQGTVDLWFHYLGQKAPTPYQ